MARAKRDSGTAAPWDEELKRTAFQKKAVSRLRPGEVLDLAIAFFTERGYRAGRTGRPNQVFVMGKGEGILPRVTGEISARSDVGKPGVTLVTLDAAGERLGPLMAEFYQHLRAVGRSGRRRRSRASWLGWTIVYALSAGASSSLGRTMVNEQSAGAGHRRSRSIRSRGLALLRSPAARP